MTMHDVDVAAADRIGEMFAAAEVDGFLHARDLDSDAQLGVRGDELVVSASTFKVPVLVELFRQGDDGRLDLTEQVTVPVDGRAPGPTGLSVMADIASLSWRDLALWMIVVSDNAATDVICDKVGLDNVNATMRELGLVGTHLETDCRGIFAGMVEDAGVGSIEAFPMPPDDAMTRRLRALQPERTDRTVPSEMTRLVQLIATDRAASPSSCERMRQILFAQVWPHRFASGFPEDDVMTGGKTGTIVTWRNEVGLACFPDGGRYAVAVYTRSHEPRLKHPAADAVIGAAARAAVDALRATR